MHGFEMELDDLLTEYHAKQDYGAMMACLLKPALYVLQSASTASSGTSNLDTKKTSPKNGGQTRDGKGKDTIFTYMFYMCMYIFIICRLGSKALEYLKKLG